MTYEAGVLEREASRTTDSRTRRVLTVVAGLLRRKRSPHEEALVARLCIPAALIVDLELDRHLDPISLLAVIAEESGGYRFARRTNDNGSNDLGPIQLNSIHGLADETRLSWIASLTYLRDSLIPRRIRAGQHSLSDFKAYTTGRYRSKLQYATEAWSRAGATHPGQWP